VLFFGGKLAAARFGTFATKSAQSGHRFEATKKFGLDPERMYDSGRRIT
jgi:hypothetical protein